MKPKAKLSDFKKMIIGMALIMSASLTMHVFIFSKKARSYRKLPAPTDVESPETVASKELPVEGKVVVIGTERFYLDAADGKRWMFMFGSTQRPNLGDRVRVSYSQGTPPTALKLESL